MDVLRNFKTHCSFQSTVLMCYHSSRVGSLRKCVAESQWTKYGVILLQGRTHGDVALVSQLSLTECCQMLSGVLLIQLIRT